MKVCEVTDLRYQQIVSTGYASAFVRCAVFVAVIILTFDGYAQQFLALNAKKIAEKETAIKVVSAVQRDFPYQRILEYYLFPADKIKSEWMVTAGDTVNLAETGVYYTVLLRGKRGEYIYGLYNEEGELQMLKILFLDFSNFPPEVQTAATSGAYEGYRLHTDQYIKIIGRNPKTEYVQVAVAKGPDYKILIFTNEGRLIKENNNSEGSQ